MNQRMILAIVCVLGVLEPPALADPQADAQKHMEAAAVAYKEGRFEDTLVELNKAYALDPKPELHYSIGQVYVKLDRCSDAILSYESFLASKPSQERADLANQAIATCKERLATQTDPGPDPSTTTATTTPTDPTLTTTPTTTPPVDTRRPWWKDPLGLGLTGGGAVLTITGLVLYSGARGKIEDAESANNYGQSQELYDDAKSARTTATIVTIVGLAATGVGVWRLMQKRREERELVVAPTAGGAVVTYGGSF